MLLIGLLLAAIPSARPQESSAPPPAFEVASVKPQPWPPPGALGIVVRGNTFDAEHVSLFSLVIFAYNLHDNQLSGGAPWVRCDDPSMSSCALYQVIAKAPEGPPPVRRQLELPADDN